MRPISFGSLLAFLRVFSAFLAATAAFLVSAGLSACLPVGEGAPLPIRPLASAMRRPSSSHVRDQMLRAYLRHGGYDSSVAALHRLTVEPARPVGRTDQRTAHDSREADLFGLHLQLEELFGANPAIHRMVSRGRPKVLGDGDDLSTGLVQITERSGDLGARLAHTQDQVALGDQAEFPGRAQHIQRAVVAKTRPDGLEDARHCFHVVREDFRLGLENLGQIVAIAREVGGQHLDPRAGVELMNPANCLGIEPGAFVWQIIAADTGHGCVPQVHLLNRFGHSQWLARVEVRWLAGIDLAEIAAPGTGVAADQKGSLAVLPTLEDVRAASFLADGVQILALHELLELSILGTHTRRGLDPGRLLFDRHARVADLQAQQLAAVRSDRHPLRLPVITPAPALGSEPSA